VTTELEKDLRSHFAATAERAPSSAGLYLRVRRGLAIDRARRYGAPIMGVAASLVVASIVWQTANGPRPSPPSAGGPVLVEDRSGAVASGGGLDGLCEYAYSPSEPEGISQAEFAFAGNVVEITPPPEGRDAAYRVTFEVADWYKGGDTARVTVDMQNPFGLGETQEFLGEYEVGQSMLVSGSTEGNGYESWTCGFTRYYEKSLADSWASQLANE
jgi:hypothetical protein